MDYDAIIEWLFNQFPSYQKVGKISYKIGLDAIAEFDERLGNPHKHYPTIHIAGTNGKGSTSHMIASALAANGLKVGLYTSPHLLDFRERMRIVSASGYEYISKDEVYDFIVRWKEYMSEYRPSFFEITTAMAFDYFAKRRVDVAVIEVGLGGRLDSTNIITPVLSVITNIGLEHCEHLGYSLEEIAFEKGGIIKDGVPVVIGETLKETKPVFEIVATRRSAPVIWAEKEDNSLLHINYKDLDLPGDYQMRNIRTVDAAMRVLSGIFSLENDMIVEGILHAATRSGLHGRWETLRNASGGKAQVICDTGHNAHGFRWIREQIDRISCDYEEIFFIFGVVADKDLDAIASYLPHDVHYIFTNACSQRALPAGELASRVSDYGICGKVSDSVRDAVMLADSLAGGKDLIFIGGSNFVVAEALPIF